jgi:methionyl-tRNA formyltransferase
MKIRPFINKTFNRNYNVLFFGSDDFSIPSLSALRKLKKISALEVVTPPPASNKTKRKTSNNQLYNYANEMELKVHIAPRKSLKNWEMPLTHNGTNY